MTIAEHGHFGTAAAQLGISQPSLSQALAALEAGLGVQLIERSTRRVIVTSVGRALLPLAMSTLESLDAFVSYAHGAQGELSGNLSMGVIPTIAPYILPPFLGLLRDEAPGLSPRFVEEQTRHVMDSLRQGRIDIALVGLPIEAGTGIRSVELYREDFVLVVPAGHPLEGRSDIDPGDLEELTLLLLDDGHCLRDQVLDLCRTVKMRDDPRYALTRATSLTTTIQLVAANMGCTLVPSSAVAAECQRPGIGLATFREGTLAASRAVGLSWRASSTRADNFEQLGRLITQAYEAATGASAEVLRAHVGPHRTQHSAERPE